VKVKSQASNGGKKGCHQRKVKSHKGEGVRERYKKGKVKTGESKRKA
jgi:hypothetical protein